MKRKSSRSTKLCRKGLHPMTRANTYLHPSKGPECRECKRTYMREFMREVRAAARLRKPRGRLLQKDGKHG